MKNKTLTGHLFVWGLIMAIVMGLATWEVSLNRAANPKAYNEEPISLSWQLSQGQDPLVSNIRQFCVYYKTLGDNRLSDRQYKMVAFNPTNPYGVYNVKLPTHVTGFRLDTYCIDRKSSTVEHPPKLSAITLGPFDVLNRIKAQTEQHLRFSSWLFDEPQFLNGWGSRLIPAAILVWLLCMTGLYFLLRKSLSRQ